MHNYLMTIRFIDNFHGNSNKNYCIPQAQKKQLCFCCRIMLALHICLICSIILGLDQVHTRHHQPQALSPDSHVKCDTIHRAQNVAKVR